jgi:DNA ligase-associated metallophosphoesterase
MSDCLMSDTHLEIDLRGERLLLDHRRALVWPARAALLVADTHFGKSAVFRREGVAVPEGSDEADLATLTALVEGHRARELYILGDYVHGALPRGHGFYARFNAWRRGLDCELHVVLGNHDVHLECDQLEDVQWHRRLDLAPFELVHDPEEATDAFFLCGHIHPVLTLASRHDALRMPVFWQREAGLVLPSFGSMTGGHAIVPARGEQVYAVGPERVTAVTMRAAMRGAGRR